MTDQRPVLVWLRRDLRLSDHPAFHRACQLGKPVIPVYIYDDQVDGLGAAPKFRLGHGLERLSKTLEERDSRLILRKGNALETLRQLISETGSDTVFWTCTYDPAAIARDTDVKSALKDDGITVRSFGGHLLFEPWSVETKQGGLYRVYTPFWNAVKNRDVDAPLPAPTRITAPSSWPASDTLDNWQMSAAMNRGAEIVLPYLNVGEEAAQDRLARFIDERVNAYADKRDILAEDGTSGLSENLAVGEISPHQCWHAAMRAREEGQRGAEVFMKELVWREFAYHLMYHTPHILNRNWREDWDAFPWNEDETVAVSRWKQGQTGIELVDAAMRELYVTGRMHNRGRMIVASYLTKHMLTHWRIGQKWFEECLIDWDPAANAMGWQWSAGSGPDATPYFRVFNPDGQRDKFDPDRRYIRRWIAEGQGTPPKSALDFYEAAPRRWGLHPSAAYPTPVVALDVGRKQALAAYENRSF